MPDQATILQRVAIGELTAVDDCIEQYGGLVWSIGKRYLRDTSDLEDVTQEVFIELWQKAGRFDPLQGTEAGFVALITRRRMMDRVRHCNTAKNTRVVLSVDDMGEVGISEVDPVVWGEEVRQTANCLRKLNAVRRRVLVMHLRDGQSHNRIADALQLPLGTIKSHARRGLLQMQRCLGVNIEVGRSSSLAKGDLL